MSSLVKIEIEPQNPLVKILETIYSNILLINVFFLNKDERNSQSTSGESSLKTLNLNKKHQIRINTKNPFHSITLMLSYCKLMI